MDRQTRKSERRIAIGIVLVLAGCAGANPDIDSIPVEGESTTLRAIAPDAVDLEASTSTTTVIGPDRPAATTTSIPAITQAEQADERAIPKLAVDEIDTEPLDELLSDLDGLLGDLDSSLVQAEGELFND